MPRFLSLLLGLLLLMPLAGRAQSPLPLQVDLDHAVFSLDEGHSLLDVYLAFGADTFPFEVAPGGFRARLPLYVSLVNGTETGGAVAWQDSTLLNFVVADTAGAAKGKFFLHQLRIPAAPGSYELRVRVPRDAATNRQELEMRRSVSVPDYAAAQGTGLSDVTLASGITPSSDRSDPFYKNGLSVRPNASLLYGQGLTQLYYYAEVYNPSGAAGENGRYTVKAYVTDGSRPTVVSGLEKVTAREVRNPDVVAGTFDLAALPTGSYVFRLAVQNPSGETVSEKWRKFFVYNPTVAAAPGGAVDISFEASPYANMPEDEVKEGLEHLDIIATDQERRRLRNLNTLDDRRRFLMDFWAKRNPNQGTSVNVYKDEFYRRLQYANERFTSNRMPGWKSDRGRTLIKYGQPTAIEPHLYEREQKPHEIWSYNNIPGEGQSMFVFADRDGFGQFEMIHSTVRGERSLPDWEVELRR